MFGAGIGADVSSLGGLCLYCQPGSAVRSSIGSASELHLHLKREGKEKKGPSVGLLRDAGSGDEEDPTLVF